MDFGQLLGNAGVVSQGQRQAEEAIRVARQNQLATEEQNRIADLKQNLAGLQLPSFQPVDVAQFAQGIAPGQALPLANAPVTPVASVAPVAPAAPSVAQAAPSAPSVAQAAPAAQSAGLQYPEGLFSQLGQARMRLKELEGPFYLPTPVGNKAQIAATKKEIARLESIYQKQAIPAARAEYQRVNPQYTYPLSTSAAPAAPSVAQAAPSAPKQTQKYDATTTPYDALITQSAQQNGIDAVIFKRLLGTESSFNPKAVSPRGEKFGLGIAQIADVHGLTRKQRLDPNTAIPFAAQLFAQYLQQNNGDYTRAIQKYKGASKTSVAAVTDTILARTSSPLEIPQTQARNKQLAEFYLANPQTIPFELQQLQQVAQQQMSFLTRQRNEAGQLAQVYMRSGTAGGIQAADRLRDSIGKIDAGLLQLQQQVAEKQTYLQGMQGLRELTAANDPRRLAGVLTQYLGAPVGIQPRTDGKYNYFVNGKKVKEGVSPAMLATMALREFSPNARAAHAKSAAMENELALKQRYGDALVNAMRDIQNSIVQGEYNLAVERAKQQNGKLTIDTTKGIAYLQRGNQVFVIPAEGTIEESAAGPITLPPVAQPVAGLNVGY